MFVSGLSLAAQSLHLPFLVNIRVLVVIRPNVLSIVTLGTEHVFGQQIIKGLFHEL